MLGWIATAVLTRFGGVEIQCYYRKATGYLYISSNRTAVNKKIKAAVTTGSLFNLLKSNKKKKYESTRGARYRHHTRLFDREWYYTKQEPIWDAFEDHKIIVPTTHYRDFDLHAERRIAKAVGKKLNSAYLGGVKRPCLACNRALRLVNSRPGPLWTTSSGLGGLELERVLKHARDNGIITYVTYSRTLGKLTVDHDSDSSSSDESDSDFSSSSDESD